MLRTEEHSGTVAFHDNGTDCPGGRPAKSLELSAVVGRGRGEGNTAQAWCPFGKLAPSKKVMGVAGGRGGENKRPPPRHFAWGFLFVDPPWPGRLSGPMTKLQLQVPICTVQPGEGRLGGGGRDGERKAGSRFARHPFGRNYGLGRACD